jgi:hypothetical protein
MLSSAKTPQSDDAPEVTVGYEIRKKDVTLVVREYTNERAWCRCSACGDVVPALDRYTKQKLENWLEAHILLFPAEHAKKPRKKPNA